MSTEVPETWRKLLVGKPPPKNNSAVVASEKVRYKDTDFYVVVDFNYVYMSDKTMPQIKSVYGGTYVNDYKVRWPREWAADSSCAYKRFHPSLATSPGAPVWLDYYLKDMDYSRGITCYLTRKDGPVKSILPALVRNGFNQVAVNKSNHSGGYNVYLLVHPGLEDPAKFKTSYKKSKKAKDDDNDKSLEELE